MVARLKNMRRNQTNTVNSLQGTKALLGLRPVLSAVSEMKTKERLLSSLWELWALWLAASLLPIIIDGLPGLAGGTNGALLGPVGLAEDGCNVLGLGVIV